MLIVRWLKKVMPPRKHSHLQGGIYNLVILPYYFFLNAHHVASLQLPVPGAA